MARQQKTGARAPAQAQPNQEDDKVVETISQAPVEPMPEQAGTMTGAAAAAAPKTPEFKGDAKAVAEAAEKPAESKGPTVKWYRVLADRNIMGAAGFRSKLRAGKEINSTMYNVARLRSQGVQLQEIAEGDRVNL